MLAGRVGGVRLLDKRVRRLEWPLSYVKSAVIVFTAQLVKGEVVLPHPTTPFSLNLPPRLELPVTRVRPHFRFGSEI